MKKETKFQKVKVILREMAIGDTIKVDSLLNKMWGDDHVFIRRSFDVFFCKAKKELSDDLKAEGDTVTRKFRVIRGELIRLL